MYTTALKSYIRQSGLPFDESMSFVTDSPLLLWFCQPLVRMSPPAAFGVMVAIQTISVVIVLVVSWRLIGNRLSPPGWILAAGLTLCSMPIFMHFWDTQVQLPLLALLMCGHYLLRRGGVVGAAALISLAGMLKLFPLALLPYPIFLTKRNQRKRAVITCAIVIQVSLLVPGPSQWSAFASHAVPYLTTFASGRNFDFTILSFVNGFASILFTPHSTQPISRAIGAILSIAMLFYTWWNCARALRQHSPPVADSCFSLLLIGALVCSVTAWTHYLVFLIYPLLLIAAQIRTVTRGKRIWLTILLVSSLFIINTARSDRLSPDDGMATFLMGQAPLLLLLVLYVHFTRAIRVNSLAIPEHHS